MDKNKASEIVEALRKNKAMSDYDLENLEFLLTADQDVIREWFFDVDDDDVEYAKTLLNVAQDYFSDDALTIDITQSAQLLKKFML